jgi:hypothetical protein
MISLLQEQKLNPRTKSEQEIIMGIFVWANDHEVNMYAKIQGMNMYIHL